MANILGESEEAATAAAANADAGLPEDLLGGLEFLDDENAAMGDSGGDLMGGTDIDPALESSAAIAINNATSRSAAHDVGHRAIARKNNAQHEPSSPAIKTEQPPPPSQQQYVRSSEIGPHGNSCFS